MEMMMKQYLDAVRQILETGTRKENRTGVDTISTFGMHYNIDLARGFPLLTTKKINFKNIVVEMLWFLSGQTNISILKRHDCRFWEPWVDEDGKVPSAYGSFWRHFPTHAVQPIPEASRVTVRAEWNDQLVWVVDTLKRDPMSRRMVVSAWAPGNAQMSKLPPCHCMFAINVQNRNLWLNGRPGATTFETRRHLCLALFQRSCDVALGVPYNIASYALLMHLLSRFSNIPVGIFSHTLVDAHIYTAKPDGSKAEYDHVPGLREQLAREPRKLPQLYIDASIRSLDDVPRLLELSTEDLMKMFVLDGYDPWPAINFKVAV
jgi:thymidylate synthase